MELLEGIKTRRSCRAFKATAVPKEIIEEILRAASNSPSYTNTQPWEVVAISGRRKEELSSILCNMADSNAAPNPDLPFPRGWPSELRKRAKLHHNRRLQALGFEQANEEDRKEDDLLNFQFYGAPCVFFLFIDRSLSQWSLFDMGLFAQNILLATHSFGLGACVQAVLARYPDVIREFFKMPKTRQLLLGISIGYPDLGASVNKYRSEKILLEDFVRWDS